MINGKFIEIITSVSDALFFEHLLDEVNHVPCVVRPVIAAVDEEDIELLPIKPEFLFVFNFFKFPVSTGALRAFLRGPLPSVSIPAHVAFPDITWGRAGQFRFLWCNNRHEKIPPLQVPGIPDRDTPVLLLYSCFSRLSQDKMRSLLYSPQNSGTSDRYKAPLPVSFPRSLPPIPLTSAICLYLKGIACMKKWI
jgi:hypothetical protein